MIGELHYVNYFLTAYHVVKGAKEIWIQSYEERNKNIRAIIYDNRYDPDYDICVLMAPSYDMAKYSLEQLYETDPDKISVGQSAIIIGHPPNEEWRLVWTNLYSKDSTTLLLPKNVVEPSNSGGPLMDIYGNLVGVVIGKNETEYGEALRIDVAFTILEKWKVPFRTKLTVNFNSIVTQLIKSSLKDFNDMKGVKVETKFGTFWGLLDKTTDITGIGQSMLVKNYKAGDRTVYYANFGRQRDETEAIRVSKLIAQQIFECISEDISIESDYFWCLDYREHWYQDIIKFIVRYTLGNEVELIIFRGFDIPLNGRFNICKDGTAYISEDHRLWSKSP